MTKELEGLTYPKAVVFDLDYTLWPCWCDTHITEPVRKLNENSVIDRYQYVLTLHKDVKPILTHLKENNVLIFTASRTETPKLAAKLIKHFELSEFVEHSEWGSFSKTRHLKKISDKYGIEFNEMILFDDEYRNKDVTRIGATFEYLPEEELTWNHFNNGIKSWNNNNNK